MPNVFYSYKVDSREAFFDSHEIQHFKVLRLKEGDRIQFTDGKGNLFKGKIKKISSDTAVVTIEEIQKKVRGWKEKIILCISSSKWQRERLLIEKAVELGVDEIVEFKSENSVIKDRKTEKLELLIRNSLKQSANLFKPTLRYFDEFQSFIQWIKAQNETNFILFDFSGKNIRDIVISKDNIGIIIGPEGGFSRNEIDIFDSLGVSKVKLGDRILRFETAALAGIIIISYFKNRL